MSASAQEKLFTSENYIIVITGIIFYFPELCILNNALSRSFLEDFIFVFYLASSILQIMIRY